MKQRKNRHLKNFDDNDLQLPERSRIQVDDVDDNQNGFSSNKVKLNSGFKGEYASKSTNLLANHNIFGSNQHKSSNNSSE